MISPNITRRKFSLLLGGVWVGAAWNRAMAEPGAPAESVFPRLVRGMNLHHLFNWPEVRKTNGKIEYVWPPFETANYKITDAELAKLRLMGFDFLRVTADPSIFIASDAARRKHLTALVIQTVKRLIEAGFNVIFDLHPVAVNPDYAPLKLVASIDGEPFKGFADVVEELARAFDGLPHDKFAFELMNEPWLSGKTQVPRWQPMLELLHTRARKGSATLPLVLTGAAWGDAKALMQLDLKPFAGSNVLYTFHYYDPHTYTHQGVAGGDGGWFIAGLQWPAAHDNITKVREATDACIELRKKPTTNVKALHLMTHKLLNDYELTAHNAARIRADFAAVAKWAEHQGVPAARIFLGEFGCVASANQVPLGEDRVQWFRAVREAAQKYSFAWALWAYKGYGGMALFDGDKMDEGIAKGLDLPRTGVRNSAPLK